MDTQDTGAMVPEQSLAAMEALAARWRGDWSEFDGRLLRDQLGHIDDLIRRECAGDPTVKEEIVEFIKDQTEASQW